MPEKSIPRLLIVGSDPDAPGTQSLMRAARRLGVDAEFALATEPETPVRIQSAAHVVYRLRPQSYAVFESLAHQLEGGAAAFLNSVLTAFDKFKTYETLSAHAIPTPVSWLIARDDTIETYPVVAKILNGNQGIGVALLNSDEDFVTFKTAFPDEQYFAAQEYIAESKGTDVRLFVVGDRVVAAMRRVAETGDFRANLHLGARMESYTPSTEEVELAVRAVAVFDLNFAGVDIIASNSGPLILEVNPSPGFGIQEISDVDIALEVVKGVVND